MESKGVSPSGSGCSAEPEPLRVSADTASIPNAEIGHYEGDALHWSAVFWLPALLMSPFLAAIFALLVEGK